MRRSAAERFWAKVEKTSGCWLWKASSSTQGYGYFTFSGRTVYAHRWIFAETYGHLLEGLFVCHHCDNPKCVRPEHLFLGTPKTNMDDKHNKGRAIYMRGAQHPLSKLNESIVWEIRFGNSYEEQTDQQVAQTLGVARSVVTNIRNGARWKHVTKESL